MSEKLLPNDISFEGPFPELTRRLRLGIVGGGRISHTQAAAARQSGYWEVVAGALSSDSVAAKLRGERWFFAPDRSYNNYQQMAQMEAERKDGVDAVLIATPNHLHHIAARPFLEAGIEVLCEKPLTNDYAEAKELVALTKKFNRVFGVCYVMSCFPMIRQAREMIRNGVIGKLNQIHVEFMQDWMMPDGFAEADHVKWRLDPAKSGPTSCTGDIGTHAHHLATFVSGLEMESLKAEMHVCGSPKLLEDTVMMLTKYTGNVPGTLMATRLASGNRGGLRLRLFGSTGGLEWNLEQPEILKYNKFGVPDQILSRGHGHGILPNVERLIRLSRGFSEGMLEAWSNLYTEFAMAIAAHKDGITPPPDWLAYPTVEQGMKGVGFIAAAVKSHNEDGASSACYGC